jgi:hypothetical protein
MVMLPGTLSASLALAKFSLGETGDNGGPIVLAKACEQTGNVGNRTPADLAARRGKFLDRLP